MRSAVGGLLLGAAVAHGQPSLQGTSMHGPEVEAFQAVARACRADVELGCATATPSTAETDGFLLPAFPPLGGPRLSVLDEVDAFSSLLDSLMEEMLQFPFSITTALLILPGSEQRLEATAIEPPYPEDGSWPQRWPSDAAEAAVPVNAAAEDLLAHIAAHTDEDDFPLVSERIRAHGKALLEKAATEPATAAKRRLARRLTELVTPEGLRERRQQRPVFLPFGDDGASQCLLRRFRRGAVSEPCGRALEALGRARAADTRAQVAARQETTLVTAYVVAMNLLLYAFVLVAVLRRRRLNGRPLHQVRAGILRATYSRPTLKAALEAELGEPLGFVPPFEDAEALDKRGHSGGIRLLRELLLFLAFLAMAVLVGYRPYAMLPLCLLLVAASLIRAVLARPVEPVYTCCRCGLTTAEAARGAAAKDQAACTCCYGTGVCSVKCEECSDDVAVVMLCSRAAEDSDIDAKDEFDSQKPDKVDLQRSRGTQQIIYQGVPVHIV